GSSFSRLLFWVLQVKPLPSRPLEEYARLKMIGEVSTVGKEREDHSLQL
ncbi:hypothetical protein CCACVL1_30147, partial [Corchorus capsularis]